MSTPCARAAIGDRLPGGGAEQDGLAFELLQIVRASPLRKAMENVSRAQWTPTQLHAVLDGEGEHAGRRKPMSAWPTSTNFTVAVHRRPGCMSVSSRRIAAFLAAQ